VKILEFWFVSFIKIIVPCRMVKLYIWFHFSEI